MYFHPPSLSLTTDSNKPSNNHHTQVLDKVLSDDIINEYGNSDIAINQVLRGATREGVFVFEAEDLDPETRMLMDSQSMFMDVSLRLNRVEITNLDKFTAVDLLIVLRNLLGTNAAMSTYEQTSHAGLGVGIELTMAMQPPSGEVQAVTFSCGVDGVAYVEFE